MGLTAAAGGFVIFLLSVSGVQDEWRVTYAPTGICATKGSTVDMHCIFTYPSTHKVQNAFWLTKSNNNPLHSDSDYTGRVEYNWYENNSTLKITNLTGDDSADYKFRFITNRPDGGYTGQPGVTLSVTDLQLHVNEITVSPSNTEAKLSCRATCIPLSYVWFKNGQKVPEQTFSYTGCLDPGDNISCALKGHEDYRSPSLYALKFPSVSVSPSGDIMEGSSVNVTCSSGANIEAKYTWYKNETYLYTLSEEPLLFLSSIQSSDSGLYYCTAENVLGDRTSEYLIDVKYAPRTSSVSVSPTAEIVEGSSVTLNCSSDANPAATYTWYKENQKLSQGPEGIYHFTPISSVDSGIYYCKSENQYGQINSSSLILDVQYAPKLLSVSVSPSAEIVEGSSVTLTCSSDANPAANYTWYKKNVNLRPVSEEPQLVFSSIQSSDSGEYNCTAENELGRRTSNYISIDVKYAQKPPSVSVCPSEIVEGSSVTLMCSSDANPAANYTWYKENEDSPKVSGQIFIITDFRAEHSGNYHCEAENSRGHHRSTIHLSVGAGEWKLTVAVTFSAISVCVTLIFVLLWTRKKRATTQPSEPTEKPDNSAQKQPAEQEGNVHYARIHFSNKQADPLYSNTGPAHLQKHKREEKMDSVEYSTVKFNSGSTAPGNRSQEIGVDPAALHSTVNKTPKNHGHQNF